MTTKTPRFNAGERRPGATRLNQLADPLNRVVDELWPAGSAGVDATQSGVILLRIRTLPTITPWTFIMEDLNDNGTGPTYTAEEFPEFREASRGSISYTYTDANTRTANPGAETQKITPEYQVGDILVCAFLVNEGYDNHIILPGPRWWAAEPSP